jgi:hypothetical protein
MKAPNFMLGVVADTANALVVIPPAPPGLAKSFFLPKENILVQDAKNGRIVSSFPVR